MSATSPTTRPTVYIDTVKAVISHQMMGRVMCMHPDRIVFLGSGGEVEDKARETGYQVENLPVGTEIPRGTWLAPGVCAVLTAQPTSESDRPVGRRGTSCTLGFPKNKSE